MRYVQLSLSQMMEGSRLRLVSRWGSVFVKLLGRGAEETVRHSMMCGGGDKSLDMLVRR